MVFNKLDLLKIKPRVLKAAYPGSISHRPMMVMPSPGCGIMFIIFFRKNLVSYTLSVGVADQTTLSKVYNNCLVLSTDYDEDGSTHFQVQSTRATMAKLRKYVTSIDDETKN